MKILRVVEATTINAVAKNVLEFHRVARELAHGSTDFPKIEACIATFARGSESEQNDFLQAARKLELGVEIISERKRFDFAAISALKNVVEQQRPDIVVTHSVKSHFLLWRSQVWRKYPWVAFHHGYTTTDLKMSMYNRADRWSLPKAGRLVTVCQAFAQDLARKTGVPVEQIAVQHNSVRAAPSPSVADVQSLRTRCGIADGERVVLAVGRLSREKAHIDLLASFKLLHETRPDLASKLIIVGDGPERARLEAAAQADGLRPFIVFAGQVNDVQPYYAAAEVFALPSHSEGSPNVVLEAMAANLPIVATAVGGVPEVVENNETALLVPVSDPLAMAQAIARILGDAALTQRLTTNAATMVSTRYTPENYVRSLATIYHGVIDSCAKTTMDYHCKHSRS